MSLIVSYQPEDHGEPLFMETELSASYEDVINAACDMWSHQLPPENRIVGRRLSRQARLATGALVWVAITPLRFVEVVRDAKPDELELRLQLECATFPSSPIDDSVEPDLVPFQQNELEIHLTAAPLLIDGNNVGHHGKLTESPGPTVVPLTPDSLVGLPRGDHGSHSPASAQVKLPTISPFDKGVDAFLAGRHDEARVRFQQAAHESHGRADICGEADCLRHLGTTCRHLKDYVAARSHLTAAKAMYKSLGPDSRQEELRCDRHLARIEADSGNHKGALMAYQQLLRVTDQEGQLIQHTWCTYYLGHLLNRMKCYPEARSLLRDALNTSRNIQHHEIEGFATEELGYTAEREGRAQLAMECYEKAFGVFKEHGEGKWIENENRVKKRMDQLARGFPVLFNTKASRRWSIGARLLNRSISDQDNA